MFILLIYLAVGPQNPLHWQEAQRKREGLLSEMDGGSSSASHRSNK